MGGPSAFVSTGSREALSGVPRAFGWVAAPRWPSRLREALAVRPERPTAPAAVAAAVAAAAAASGGAIVHGPLSLAARARAGGAAAGR
jgi:hypothetical protein